MIGVVMVVGWVPMFQNVRGKSIDGDLNIGEKGPNGTIDPYDSGTVFNRLM
jgi:hypothetical protein